MTKDKCMLCGDSGNPGIYIAGQNFNIIRCQCCGLIWQQIPENVKNDDLYSNMYDEKYHPTQDRPYWQERMKVHYDDIMSSRAVPGTLLDIGCSYGFLMQYFNERGWRSFGIDISEQAVAYAKQKGLSCCLNTIETFAPKEKFDAIVLSNVLEHLKNPLETLAYIKKWLSFSGIIYIRVPNIDSIVLFSRKQSFIGDMKPFEHLFYFNRNTLEALLRKAGLQGTIKSDGRVTLGNILNCYLRSKFVLNSSWQELNYHTGTDKKEKYLWLKHIYGEILITAGNIPFGPNNRELAAIARGN